MTTADLSDRPRPPSSVRVAPAEVADLSPEQRSLYTAIVEGPRSAQRGSVPIVDANGRLLGPFGLMLLSPAVGEAVQQVGAALRFRSGLSARAREFAILTVAARLGSAFEWWAHERAALDAGISVSQLQQILDGGQPDDLTEVERTVVAVTERLVVSRGLTDEEYASAERVLGQARLADVTWLVGYYAALALALEVFRPPQDRPPQDVQ
jgi:alkylhydroperoxidase family enzyme